MDDRPTGTSPRSPFLGAGVLFSAFALAVLFSDAGSMQFRLGLIVGQLAGAAALSLPIFLVWRFATASGRRQPLGVAFNVFSGLVVVAWLILFVVVKNALVSLEPRLKSESPVSLPKTEPRPQTSSNSSFIDFDAKPTYDSKGWTQESTGSTERGPWLNHDPPGTRYYRDAQRVIYRVYPPGVRPNAEPANPFGLGDSTPRAPE
jgi:hypothetical protein